MAAREQGTSMANNQRAGSEGVKGASDGPESLTEHIEQNIESLVAIQKRESETRSKAQRRLEVVSRFIARPLYLVGAVGVTIVWIGINLSAPWLRFTPFDPPPFQILDDLLSFTALMTTTVVLIAQNRQTKLEQQRMHLDLQINLLTEQKVSKCIHLLEELRRDLPIVHDRHDRQADLLQRQADTEEVLTALEKGGLTEDQQKFSE